MSRVGIVIRCANCEGTGHNRSSCDKKSATVPSGGAAYGSATRGMSGIAPSAPPASVPRATTPGAHFVPGHASGSNQGPTTSKRKQSLTIGSQDSIGTTTANNKAQCSTSS